MLSGFFSRCGLAALLIVGCREIAGAQATPSPAPSSSPLVEIGRVTTSDRRPEPIGQTTRPTFVIDRARIQNEGARTIAEALQDVPGIELFPYGPFGAQVDYGMRGATSSQTLVLIDGVPVADPASGTATLGQLSTIGVDRVEVVESGSSTLYGTSAIGGVINIITRVPRGTYLGGSLGSYADRDVRVGIGNGVVGGSFERHVAANRYPYPALNYGSNPCGSNTTNCVFPATLRTNTFGQESSGRFDVDAPLAVGMRVRARLDTSATLIGVPGRVDFTTPNATQAISNDTALLEFERATRTSTLTLTGSGLNQRLAYNDPANGGESNAYSGRSQLSLKNAFNGTHIDAVVGIDLTRDSARYYFAPGQAGPQTAAVISGAAESQVAGYVQVGATPYREMRVVVGLRAENDAPRGSVLAPSFGGTVRLGSIHVAGNVSESFRVPALNELYYPIPDSSNPNLAAEKARNADVTVALERRDATVSVGWFGRSGSNFIVYDPSQNYRPYNASRAQTAGVVVRATTRSIAGLVLDASFTDLYKAINLTTGGRLPRNPVGQATLALTHPFANGRIAYQVRFRAIGSDGDDHANVTPPLTGSYDAYSSLDAYVRYKLSPQSILSLRSFNFGNDREAPIFGYPNQGRRFAVELATQ